MTADHTPESPDESRRDVVSQHAPRGRVRPVKAAGFGGYVLLLATLVLLAVTLVAAV